jgi:Ran GTPase-activating protein (RanGAP) involved in mRNA processing and transport
MMTKNLNTSSIILNSEMNNLFEGVRIVRLHSGEDIIAGYSGNTNTNLVVLDNPMHLIFKRTPQGIVMMMLPWLPIELIKDNIATILSGDILTIVDPKDNLKEYYHKAVNTTQIKMLKDNALSQKLRDASDEDEDEDEEENEDEDPEGDLTKEDVVEIINRKKTNRLH